ncbi:MAG: ribulose-phosphate 3-epimerase [Thermomicrobiales bacterium]|nr:ribulose-phosphate 3-epimerase [Thermomicrobiales bacterium]
MIAFRAGDRSFGRSAPGEDAGVTHLTARIGPSILSADFLRLGAQIDAVAAAGADYIHVDVMDGRYVPNITVGPPVLRAVRGGTSLPVDVHLMIVEPAQWIDEFVAAGADVLTIHVEADVHVYRTLRAIEEAGAAPGIAINPGTPLVMLEDVLPIVRQVLIMTVNPGFGGQTFIPASLDRIRRMREMIDRRNPQCTLQIDGGIRASNIRKVVEAGADSIVIGSSIFVPDRPVSETMGELRAALAATN